MSCTGETAKKQEKAEPLSKESKEERRYKRELRQIDQEKIALFSIIYKIDKTKIVDIIVLYETKIGYNDDADYLEKVIDTISEKKQFPKEEVAKIIFSYKYELLTKQEIEDNYSDELYDRNVE